jgi:acyl carrier protein
MEPAEVEAATRSHSAVEDVAVVAVQLGGELSLVAHVVRRRRSNVPAEELIAFLGERLPTDMLPSSIVFTDELPRTAHGKVDRSRLLAAPRSVAATTEDFREPSTPMEAAVSGVLAQLLKRERVGVDDDVWEFGMHSLLAARVAVAVREVFGVEIDVASVFRSPTVRDLAAIVSDYRRATG